MLINLSNHPIQSWTTEQLASAQERWGEVVDYAFPNVDPVWDIAMVTRKAAKIVEEVVENYDPTAVHVMGEQTMVYQLVNLFQQRSVLCVASTTKRSVVHLEDGSMQRYFTFYQFRPYR